MSLDLNQINQQSLFFQSEYRTQIDISKDHPLVILEQSISWSDLMEQAIPLLYHTQGISLDIGRRLNLRAHLGAYILQTVHNWTDRWTEEMLKFYVPARIFCGFLESSGSLDHTKIEKFRNRLGENGAHTNSRN
ncbi:MAG: transposase [Maribacter sp.]|nr:transposase [Maribacter sp.]